MIYRLAYRLSLPLCRLAEGLRSWAWRKIVETESTASSMDFFRRVN